VARKIDNCAEVIKAQAQHADPDLGPGLVERVTRIELALSAWEAERSPLSGVPTWQIC
jgi:hypothetical protein